MGAGGTDRDIDRRQGQGEPANPDQVTGEEALEGITRGELEQRGGAGGRVAERYGIGHNTGDDQELVALDNDLGPGDGRCSTVLQGQPESLSSVQADLGRAVRPLG